MIVGRIGPAALACLLLNASPSTFVEAEEATTVFLMRSPMRVGDPPLRPPPSSSLDDLESSFLASVDAVHETCGADVATVCPTPEERFLADLSGGSDPILSALFGPPPGGFGGDIDDFLRSVMPPPHRMTMTFGPREDPLGALLDEFVETAILAAGAPFPPPPPEAKEEEESKQEDAVEDRSSWTEREDVEGSDERVDTSGFEDEELLGAVASEEEEKAARAEAVLDAMVGRLAERYSSGSARSEASEDRDDEEVAADALLTDEELAQRIARHGIALAKAAEEPKSDEESEAKVEEDEDPELRRRLARRLSEVDETFFAVPGGFVVMSRIEPRGPPPPPPRRGKKGIRRKIVRAVYDDPALKSAVQERVGESLGDAPPRLPRNRRREVVLVEDEEARLPALHFGCRRDGCLWEARKRGAVSPPCARAMDRAKVTFNDLLRAQEKPQRQDNGRRDAVVVDHFMVDPEIQLAAQAQRRQKDLKVAAEVSALSVFLLSFSLSLSVFVLLRLAFRRRRGGGKFGRMRMRMGLRRKIMAAVYDDPALKSAVEEKVGESLGDAPPPHHRRREKCGLFHRFCRSLPLAGLAILLVLTSLTNPDAVLLVGGSTLVCMTLYGALASCFCSSSEDEQVQENGRTCCCCGASPSDDNATETETSSCECCNGTGVCGPDCATCGSQANKGYPGARALECRREGAPAAAYVGVPVQVV